MQLFYTKTIKDGLAYLHEEEARHCVQVLRHQPGDQLQLMDGVGGLFQATILSASKKSVTLSIQSQTDTYKHRQKHLHIAIAPTKNINRLEWFLEKATEMGIDEITPIWCQRSERKVIKPERLEKVILAAAKQSGNIHLPMLNEMMKLSAFFEKNKAIDGQQFIAHCEDGNDIHLMEKYNPDQDVIILIGPEGDFSPVEIEKAFKLNYMPISLGKSRLRTETAGIAACHCVNLQNWSVI